jgi:hypothetical protein
MRQGAPTVSGFWQWAASIVDDGGGGAGRDSAQQRWTVAADVGCGVGCGRAHQGWAASIVDNGGGGAGGGSAGGGGDSGGSGQQLGVMAVAGNKWLWTSSPHLAKMADGFVNRNMTNMRKFGFLEYVFETEKMINEKF